MTPTIPECTCGLPMEPAAVSVGEPIHFCRNCDTAPKEGAPQTAETRRFESEWQRRIPSVYSGRAATRNPRMS